jgi:hypothetical protein
MIEAGPDFKRFHVANRLRIKRKPDAVRVKCSRIGAWTATVICFAVVLSYMYFALAPVFYSEKAFVVIVGIIFATPLAVVLLGYLAWSWRIKIDRNNKECVYQRTYLGVPYHTQRASLLNGLVGPSPVQVEWVETEKRSDSAVVSVAHYILGPIGAVASALVLSARPEVKHKKIFPGIIHYDETTDETTVMLVLGNCEDRDRILAAFVELAPDLVSTA